MYISRDSIIIKSTDIKLRPFVGIMKYKHHTARI
jgi:hypothetical protein